MFTACITVGERLVYACAHLGTKTFVNLTFANVREPKLVHAREGRDACTTFAFRLACERSVNVTRAFISWGVMNDVTNFCSILEGFEFTLPNSPSARNYAENRFMKKQNKNIIDISCTI